MKTRRTKNKRKNYFLSGLIFFMVFIFIPKIGLSPPSLPPLPQNENCNVHFGEIKFEVKLASEEKILSIDQNGNMLIHSNVVYTNQASFPSSTSNSVIIKKVSDPLFMFNTGASYIKGQISQTTSVPDLNGYDLIIKDLNGNRIINFNDNGNIYLSGYAVYDGSQANCSSGLTCHKSGDGIYRCI